MYIYQYIYGDEISRVNYQDPCIHWCIYYNTIIVIMYRNQPRPFFLPITIIIIICIYIFTQSIYIIVFISQTHFINTWLLLLSSIIKQIVLDWILGTALASYYRGRFFFGFPGGDNWLKISKTHGIFSRLC